VPSYTFTSEQLTDILNWLRPYLPAQLTTVTPRTYNLRYTFAPFTGLEPEPEQPNAAWHDPKLARMFQDEKADRPVADDAEYELRSIARSILHDVYREARIAWKNARHVAQLREVVGDTGDLWKAHQQAKSAVDAAFTYLRDPQAATEWTSAVSRLIDAQDTYRAAARAFDTQAQQIARVHRDNFHEEMLGYDEALAAAGFPEGKAWDICPVEEYGYANDYTVAGQAKQLIAEQNEHVAKVGRLTGQPTT